MPVVRQTIYSTHDGNTLLQQNRANEKSVQREEAEAEVTRNTRNGKMSSLCRKSAIVGSKLYLSPAETATL